MMSQHYRTLLTLQPIDAPTEGSWLAALNQLTPPPAEMLTWVDLMERSYVEVTANAESIGRGDDGSAKQITDHINWDRYLSLVQGRSSRAPIKFNGQAFNCNNTGKGWDSRDWGAGYWWHGARFLTEIYTRGCHWITRMFA
jgi:hypothetical protein